LNSTQKKEVKKIAKSFQGTGPAGAAGPAGAPGAAGAKGDAGAAGSNGSNGVSATTATFSGVKGACTNGGVIVKSASPEVNVCNGKPGVDGEDGETGFTETLPSGKTEMGAWGGAFEEVGSVIGIPFSIPLAAPLDNSHVLNLGVGYDGEDETGPQHERCPGTAANPRAAVGHLCVYTGSKTGAFLSVVIFDPSKDPFAAASVGASKAGAGLLLSSDVGVQLATGTWAVTAP
jgi:hypothetical protein